MIWVISALLISCLSGLRRFAQTVETTQVFSGAVVADVGDPLLPRLIPADPHYAAIVVFLERHIPVVFSLTYASQVGNSVIQLITIDVVDVTVWPFAIVDRPNRPMCANIFIKDRSKTIPVESQCSKGGFA
jgi:hypothetical protein